MLNRNILISLFVSFYILLPGCQKTVSTLIKGLSETTKPIDFTPPKLAIKQPKLPTDQDWKENPFIETVVEPIFTEEENKRGYILFKRPITDIVYSNSRPKTHERIKNLTSFGCRGEFEPITFTLYPNRQLRNLKVRTSNLKSSKNSIPASNISVRLQTYWQIPYPHYVTKKNYKWRWIPELIEEVTVHTSPAKECQRYWLTVKVPEKTPPGVYKGNITIWDDGYSKAITIPISFRVMSFELKKDPSKHYTAYYYDYLWKYDDSGKKAKNNAWIIKAATNSYRAMKDHGFDAMPTTALRYNNKKDFIYAIQGDRIMETAKKAGFKDIPFVLVGGGNAIEAIIKKYDKNFKRKSHWKISDKDIPSDEIYAKITTLFKKFNDKWNAKGYPPLYCCAADEIAPSAWKYGKKTYAAVKKSGIGVYITKSPQSIDAVHYRDIVDAFCSQSYAIPYKDVISDKKMQYWCYPNHNSWEVRRPTVMSNGGRMTYGFGNWKSGYTVLVPWSWSAIKINKPVNYFNLRTKQGKSKYVTPGGNNADKNGNVLLTTYWQCFREGYDDGRYIYTLQKSIIDRESNPNKDCKKLIIKSKALLQKIWDNIKVEQKYKGPETVSILPSEFDAFRWQIAVLIEKLSYYKKEDGLITPSVIVNTQLKTKNKTNILFKEKEKGNLIVQNLGDEKFNLWKTSTGEATISVTEEQHFTGKKSLKLDIKIDHKSDGGGEKGEYPIGWPRIRAFFEKGSVDLTKYEFLYFQVMIDSDRDEVADDNTPAYWTFASHIKGSKLPKQRILGQLPQRTWIPIIIPINEIINHNDSLAPWKSIKAMQFGIGESRYNDGTNLTFYIDNISLISFKMPLIESILAPSTILTPLNTLYCKINTLGTAFIKKGEYKILLMLIDSKETTVAKISSELKDCHFLPLKLNKLKPGAYILKGKIINKSDEVVSTCQKEITLLAGHQ